MRLAVHDEVSGAVARRTLALDVPLAPRPGDVPQPPAGAQVTTGEDLGGKRVVGSDNLVLLPPPGETVLNLWRATALVSGDRIERVVFLVDGERQLESRRRPYSAELRLAELPTEQVVRAEGYDAEGHLVAADEVVLNRPRAAFKVRIVSPPEGAEAAGTVRAEADVSVPDEKRLEKVEFRVDDELVATLTEPPFETDVTVPAGGDVSFLSVTAELADGTRTEAVRILNAGEGFAEKVDVRLVELYVAAQDGQGRLVRDLGARRLRGLRGGRAPGGAQVRADGRPAADRRHRHRHLRLDGRLARRGAARRHRVPAPRRRARRPHLRRRLLRRRRRC